MYDIFGKNILDECLLKELVALRIQSFYRNKKLEERIDTVYLNFGSWISFFYDDGVLFIKDKAGFKPEITRTDTDIIEYQFLDLDASIPNCKEILNNRLTNISVDNFKLLLTFNNTYLLTIEQQEIGSGWFGETLINLSKK